MSRRELFQDSDKRNKNEHKRQKTIHEKKQITFTGKILKLNKDLVSKQKVEVKLIR